MSASMPAPRLITIDEASTMTGVGILDLHTMRLQSAGPRSFKFGARVVYLESEALEWNAARSTRRQRPDR